MNYQIYKSPVGPIYLVEQEGALTALIFAKNWLEYKKKLTDLYEKSSPLLLKTIKQLDQYFRGQRKNFDIPYVLNGTEFQNRVWRSLARIPFGKTKSYKDQALLVKAPKAYRAIGRTNGLNPISIILPCHRVIGSNGALTGYGGGLEIKRYLLQLEGIEG